LVKRYWRGGAQRGSVGNSVTSTIAGLDQLNRKIRLMKQAVDGPPLTKLLRTSAAPIARQAKQNARKGATGLVARKVAILTGKKASKFGAMVLVKAAWKGTGAVFEEWGTKDHAFDVMRIPLSKLGAVGRRKVAKLTGAFGFAFARKIKGMKGTRFFENAVDQKMPESQKQIEKGISDLIVGAIR
jgi:hypothetical protein